MSKDLHRGFINEMVTSLVELLSVESTSVETCFEMKPGATVVDTIILIFFLLLLSVPIGSTEGISITIFCWEGIIFLPILLTFHPYIKVILTGGFVYHNSGDERLIDKAISVENLVLASEILEIKDGVHA
ncbi:hypothetical protein VNO78_06317 [Psophocarpus tetragonolobus]|uniref:Uncharacterized protein n=1 Tax=Psophocarpus tetragonolobus TaxID=3891 RepID=A0AAN9SU14_PSOTE